MNTSDEKVLFSQRLRQALTTLNFPTNKPTWFAREFNARSLNATISVQTANNWLLGTSIPSQDKLQIVSHWLNVSSQWLRFGEDAQIKNDVGVESVRKMYGTSTSVGENCYAGLSFQSIEDLPKKIARLTPAQKQAIDHVVDVMLGDDKV